ncbi:hypothetical protein Q1695_010790 [Nippostrongylus brasiliensis]|nr:hypothetical protein Q1695_010790 [Nippostrongylus brasiliensis]
MLILFLSLRTTLACVASKDPEEIVSILYKQSCNGETRNPCPTAAQVGLSRSNGANTCTLRFTCPAYTQAYVWTSGGATPIAYSGSELICNRSDRKWRTFMGLVVEEVSCMGAPAGCGFCPTPADVYRDCSYYGRIMCATMVSQTSSIVTRGNTGCNLIALCPPGMNFNYITATGTTDTLTSAQTMTCPFPPGAGDWSMPGGPVTTGYTCMSNP